MNLKAIKMSAVEQLSLCLHSLGRTSRHPKKNHLINYLPGCPLDYAKYCPTHFPATNLLLFQTMFHRLTKIMSKILTQILTQILSPILTQISQKSSQNCLQTPGKLTRSSNPSNGF